PSCRSSIAGRCRSLRNRLTVRLASGRLRWRQPCRSSLAERRRSSSRQCTRRFAAAGRDAGSARTEPGQPAGADASALPLLQRLFLLDRLGVFRLVDAGGSDAGGRRCDDRLIRGAAFDRRHLAAAMKGGVARLVAALLQPDLLLRLEPMVDIAALAARLLPQLVGSSRDPFSHLIHVAVPDALSVCAYPTITSRRVFRAGCFTKATGAVAWRAMALAIEPIDPINRPFFAGEVSGCDVARPLSPADIAAIQAGMDRYGVLVFPEQRIDDDAQVAFSRSLGPLEQATGDIAAPEERRLGMDLNDISNLDKHGRVLARDDRRRLFGLGNQLWHSDSSFK